MHAFDYLLKPFGRERFQEALARARARLAEGREEQLARRLVSLVQDVGQPQAAAGSADGEVGRARGVPAARRARRRGVRGQLRAPARRRARAIWCARRWPASRRDWAAIGSAASIAAGSSTSIASAKLHVRANGEHELVTHEGRNYRVGRAYRDAVQERLQLRECCRLRIADCGLQITELTRLLDRRLSESRTSGA